MRAKDALIAIGLILVAAVGLAKTRPAKRSVAASTPKKIIRLTATYGDRVTEIVIESSPDSSYLTIVGNPGQPRGQSIRKSDVDYVLSKLGSVPLRIEATDLCSRSQLRTVVSMDGKTVLEGSACLDDRSPSATAMLDLANLLVTRY